MTTPDRTRGQDSLATKRTVSRFAPSPTGQLHIGHAYSAVLAHDFTRARGGVFLLRIEDIDPGRARPEYVAAIADDIAWLGLHWDGDILLQSSRGAAHAAALEGLKRKGLAYPCFCTRSEIAAEIAASASAPHAAPTGPDGPIYPGTCRLLDPDERVRRIANEPHAWRLDMVRAMASAGPLHWSDHGESVTAKPEMFGDIVLARKDAPTSYHLAVTLDDAAQGVTDVVRGRDLRAATHVHRLLQALLGLPTPCYHHHALLADAEGRRLAKRHGAPSLAELRMGGMEPAALVENLRQGRLPAGFSIEQA